MTAITIFGSNNIHDKLYHSNQLKVSHLINYLKINFISFHSSDMQISIILKTHNI